MLHLIRIQFNWLTLVFGHHLKCDQILYFDGALPLKLKKQNKNKLNTTRDLKYKGLQKQEMNIIQNNEKSKLESVCTITDLRKTESLKIKK